MKRNGRMTRKITYSALFLAVAILLPFLTGQIPTVGRFLSPMHIPAFLCGFVCGPWWGAAVGAASPLLRSLMLGMPPMPTAAFMAIELAVYGAASGLFRRIFPKKNLFLYPSLLLSMITGRLVYSACEIAFFALTSQPIEPLIILAESVTGTWAGIILQLIVIPPIVVLLEKTDTRGTSD